MKYIFSLFRYIWSNVQGDSLERKLMMEEKLNSIALDARDEAIQASIKFKPFNSAHEGFGVLLEEVDELKAEVWKNQTKRDPALLRKEAIQVAAMAIRFVMDICDGEKHLV